MLYAAHCFSTFYDHVFESPRSLNFATNFHICVRSSNFSCCSVIKSKGLFPRYKLTKNKIVAYTFDETFCSYFLLSMNNILRQAEK